MKSIAIMLGAVVLSFLTALSYAQAPVPFINLPLVPDATPPGGGDFTLTLNGTGFVSNSVVNWNGTPLATQFVSGSQLTATVPAANIATASTANVTVVNPAPGGTSNTAFFTATYNTGSYAIFNPPSSFSTRWYGGSVAVGDFNGDGILDLAAGGNILLGDSTGNFTLASTLFWGFVAVGDFNGDGKLDIAGATLGSNPGGVLAFLGDGTGQFTRAFTLDIGWPDGPLAVGDFNGDGKLDIVVADGGNNNLSILLGDGTGNFILASSPVTGSGPSSVAVGDFNGDGKLDLAVGNSDGTVSILVGDGTGNFTPAALLTSPTGAVGCVAVGDLDGDGKLDLAVAVPGDVRIYIYLGDGTGNFALAQTLYTPWNSPRWVAVGDFNGDGILDLAVANFTDIWPYVGSIAVMLGDGTGNFTGVPMPGIGPGVCPASVASGDFTGNGRLDIAFIGSCNNTVNVLLQVPPSPAVMFFPPGGFDFGTQLVGTASALQMVTLWNTGHAPLNISIAASANFFQKNNCGTSLAAGASCFIKVIFRPHSVGAQHGTLTFTDNASDSPQMITLSGVGTHVALTPASLDFGSQVVGTTSQPQTVTLTNYSSKILNISSIHFTGANTMDFAQESTCSASIAPGGSCTISVSFAPLGRNAKSATLAVYDNGGGSPQQVALTGTGTPAVILSPDSLDFGSQAVGSTSPPQTVTLTNQGAKTVSISSMHFTGDSPAAFTQNNNCGTSVVAGGSCTISVSFAPKGKGAKIAALSVYDNGGGSPQQVALTGSGTP